MESDLARSAGVRDALEAIMPALSIPGATEVCFNGGTNVAFVDNGKGWIEVPCPKVNGDWGNRLASAAGAANNGRGGINSSLLEVELPNIVSGTGNMRGQIIKPPSCEQGKVVVSIRIPSQRFRSHKELADGGLYRGFKRQKSAGNPFEDRLLELLDAGNIEAFMELAVKSELTIFLSGKTSSGKTTLLNALVDLMPKHLRVVTIENVLEIVLRGHKNAVRLLYDNNNKHPNAVGPDDLMISSLRLAPERLLFGEIRGYEAFTFVRNVCSGHKGTIATGHAGSPSEAFEMLMFAMYQHPHCKGIAADILMRKLHSSIDVIVQCDSFYKEGDTLERLVTDVYYDPQKKRELALA